MRINVNIDPRRLMQNRGAGGKAALYLASRVKARSDPYTPMQQGILKNSAQVQQDGTRAILIYNVPYAHYQYIGKTMGPNVLTKFGWRSMPKNGGKYYTGSFLTYHGAQMRGAKWIPRMMAAHKNELEQDMIAYMNRGAK